ncbi:MULTISPECIES: DUF5787 family protein [Halobacterium]|nr:MULTISPECIES: DUF5787 family protein [Halobacterium]MCF2164098.1 hypothetical protein [Halobacterium salinarum]MCF2167826.1 hypothetical protein [Halobacterium salinarum]MCF2239206.1 hypothetical protein [Halobacterium salinarum]QRY23030.1 hypothetical protein JT689_03090 [Halobacterium sp. GSL-19]
MTVGHEFGFELRVCAWAEACWRPERDGAPRIVARQLGTKRRRWDTIILEVDPEGLRRRAQFGAQRLDADLLHVVRHAPTDWAFYRDALPTPEYPWRYVREAVHRASDRGILETRRDGNKIEIRRAMAYPEWVRRIVAIENKPDLDASAADALTTQLRRDVALGLADEVWVATADDAAGGVQRALLADLPVEAGILVFDDDWTATVEWLPHGLATAASGTRLTSRPADGADRPATGFEYVDADWKAHTRLAIAERAFERGWRSYVDTMRPDCRQFRLVDGAHGYVPACAAKAREQSAAECGGSCADYEPEPPGWRQHGWPIEGGPGATVQAVLADRRQRRRE